MRSYIIIPVLGSLVLALSFPVSAQAAVYSCGGLPATIVGTAGNDNIVGTPGVDVIVGLGGNDYIAGGTGNDFICGNEGNDTLYGNQGNDWMEGNQGTDVLYGGQDNDVMYGGQDNDQLYGNLGRDFLEGNLGSDIVNGNEDRDSYGLSGATQVGTLDMKAYCRRKQGTGDVERKRSDIYSWKCEFKIISTIKGGFSYTYKLVPIDIEDVCTTFYGSNAYPIALNQKDAYSWRCYTN